MGTTKGSADPDHSENLFAFYYKPAMIAAVPKLSFILAEAMVNHKKMVHPPCAA